nr:exosome complex component RRP41-like protein [Cryptomonas curvata]
MSLDFNIRFDGRYYNEIRPVKIYSNPVTSCFTSLQMSIGLTTVIVSIVKERVLEEISFQSVHLKLFSVKITIKTQSINYTKEIILKILNYLYPWKKIKCKIIFNLIIVEEDGDLLTVAMNALFLAIYKANFFPELKAIFCSIGLLKNNKNLILNSRLAEELFVKSQIYFIKIKNFKKKKSDIKVLYYGELIELNENAYEKIIKLGKYYLKSFQKILNSY